MSTSSAITTPGPSFTVPIAWSSRTRLVVEDSSFWMRQVFFEDSKTGTGGCPVGVDTGSRPSTCRSPNAYWPLSAPV
jgi:hypothetical protein